MSRPLWEVGKSTLVVCTNSNKLARVVVKQPLDTATAAFQGQVRHDALADDVS